MRWFDLLSWSGIPISMPQDPREGDTGDGSVSVCLKTDLLRVALARSDVATWQWSRSTSRAWWTPLAVTPRPRLRARVALSSLS